MVSTIRLPYGAFELKRTYRRHMLMGTGFSGMLMALCVLTVWVFTGEATMVAVTPKPVDTIFIDLVQPPGIVREWPEKAVAGPKEKAPGYGIPLPVDDGELVEQEASLPTRDEWKRHYDAMGGNSDGEGEPAVYVPPADDYIPPPETFVPMEIQPAVVFEKQADYPRLALEGGFSAVVTVLVYVDKTGTVREARAVKCTRPGMGFEEEAIKAALQWKWRPGIQNGNPIGAWMTHTVRFVLED